MSMLLLALSTLSNTAHAEDYNAAILHGGYGAVLLNGAPISGVNVGLQYRSSIGAFAFDAEPVSVIYDSFGESTGLRVGFLSPGIRGILFPERKVSPSLGAGVGFNFTAANNDATGVEFGSLQFDARFSAAVELARASEKVHPTLEVQYVVPLAWISSFVDRQPHCLMARLGIAFPTRVSAMGMVDNWFN